MRLLKKIQTSQTVCTTKSFIEFRFVKIKILVVHKKSMAATSTAKDSNPPFTPTNYWNIETLRDYKQQQSPFVNDNHAITAGVQYYGINTAAQGDNWALQAPFDPPAYSRCIYGPMRFGGQDFCVTNVVSRPISSCDDKESIKKYAPDCAPGLRPHVIGCTTDKTGQVRAQYQCLNSQREAQIPELGQQIV